MGNFGCEFRYDLSHILATPILYLITLERNRGIKQFFKFQVFSIFFKKTQKLRRKINAADKYRFNPTGDETPETTSKLTYDFQPYKLTH